uniref:Bacteriophage-related protein n=1 Tax=Ralstonia solanacearum TaxID=305 RepID=A0A0S4X303_RALSL
MKCGSRKKAITPPDASQEFLVEARMEQRARSMTQDTPLMRALGLAHYWQRLLDTRQVASVTEIAEAEGIDVTQVRQLLRLTLAATVCPSSLALTRVLATPLFVVIGGTACGASCRRIAPHIKKHI